MVTEQGATRRLQPLPEFPGSPKGPGLPRRRQPKPRRPEFDPRSPPRPHRTPTKPYRPKPTPRPFPLPKRFPKGPFGPPWLPLVEPFLPFDPSNPDTWFPNPNKFLPPAVRGPWRMYHDCGIYTQAITAHAFRSSACVSPNTWNCLSGQQGGNPQPLGTDVGATTLRYSTGVWNVGSTKIKNRVWYERDCTPAALPDNHPGRYPNPPRYAPPLPVMVPPDPNITRGTPTPWEPFPTLELPPIELPDGFEFGPEGKTPIQPKLPGPTRPPDREPPKKQSKSQQILSLIFAGLDSLSELGELVAVAYDAIDTKTRRAYEKQHLGGHWAYHNGKWHWWLDPKLSSYRYRGFLDQAGQYGISGTDYKLPALMDMYMAIDTEKFFRGILANVTEDFLIGQIHKRVPGRIATTLSNEIGQISKQLSRLAKELAGA